MSFCVVARRAVLTFLVIVCAALPAHAATTSALSEAERAIVWSVPFDPTPRKLNASRKDLEGRHYLSGDELYLHKYREHIEGVGGAFAGVGTDQTYMLIGWQRPEIAWLTDYDPWVRHLHQAYRVLFKHCDTPECFIGHWTYEKRDMRRRQNLLKAELAEHPDLKMILRVSMQAQFVQAQRFKVLKATYAKTGEVATWFNNADQYAYIRQMVLSDRVRPMQCNLLAETCFTAIAEANKQLNLPLRVLYVSNAEGYWPYKPQFRANMIAQHVDEKSYILRTNPTKKRNGDYAYHIQPMTNFQEWLKHDWVKRVYQIIPKTWVKNKDHIPYVFFSGPPKRK